MHTLKNADLKNILGRDPTMVACLRRVIQALKIDKDKLHTLWYENDDGDKHIPDFEKDMPDGPEGFNYQISRFPTYLRTTWLKIINEDEVKECLHPEDYIEVDHGIIDTMEGRTCNYCGGYQSKDKGEEWPKEWDAYGSKEFMVGESGWSEDLVLAMAISGDYTLSEAIIVSAECCERCLNVLCHDYGLDDGYEELSDEWKSCGTSCDFCEGMGNERGNKGPDFLKEENEDS